MNFIIQKSETIQKTWGTEFILVNNKEYCGKLISCNADWSSKGLFHYHPRKLETFFVLHGTLLLEVAVSLERGYVVHPLVIESYSEAITILPGTYHRFKSNKKTFCLFLEISTPHKDEDSIREDIPIYRRLDEVIINR